MISEELRFTLAEAAEDRRVIDIRIGLGYTGAMLDDGSVGVAYTFRANMGGGCSVFKRRRPLSGLPANAVLEYLGSPDRVECAVGLSVANALANRPAADHREGDILDLLQVDSKDRVGMVGFFGPLVPPLERLARELLIFEHDESRSQRTLPAAEALDILPQCDVAVITSTAIILGDLDRLLGAASNCREVAMVGASTPLAAEVFRSQGVTLLSGVTVTDGPGILQVVSEAGGMGYFGPHIRKVNVRVAG